MKNRFALFSAAALGLVTFAHVGFAQTDAQEANNGHRYTSGSLVNGGMNGGTLTTGSSSMASGGTLTYASTVTAPIYRTSGGSITSSTYSGATTVNAGTLTLAGMGGYNTSGSTLTLNGSSFLGATINSSGSLQLSSGTVFTNGTSLNSGIGGFTLSNGNLNLAGAGAVLMMLTPNMTGRFSVQVGQPFALHFQTYNQADSLTVSGLPPGMDFDASQKFLTGTPTESGIYTATFTATSNDGTNTTMTVGFTVKAAPPAVVLKAFSSKASYASGQNGRVAICLSEPTTDDLTVNYTVAGTAANGRDIKPLSGQLLIPAGETVGMVKVTPKPSLADKGERTISIKLAPGDGYTIQTIRAIKLTVSYE